MNAIASARAGQFPRLDPRVQFPGCKGSPVYAQAESDETMAGYILTARNKLKWLNPSHQVRLNSFELAADAFALRLVQREELALEDVLAKIPGLAAKLENYRKRAKRAAIKDIGPVAYKEQAKRWGRFLQWMRCILCDRPTLAVNGGSCVGGWIWRVRIKGFISGLVSARYLDLESCRRANVYAAPVKSLRKAGPIRSNTSTQWW